MSDEQTVAVEIALPVDAIESLKRYTLDSLMLDGEVPRDIKHAITKAIASHVETSPAWESISGLIVDEVESRKAEIVKAIADRIVVQVSQGISHAATQVVQQLGTKLKSTRF